MNQNKNNSHFVYIYKNKAGKTVYVGQGTSATRATSHKAVTHNSKLRGFLEKEKDVQLHIAGPYGSKEFANAVETAVIGALSRSGIFNKANGPTKWQFKPLGVPAKFAARLEQAPITSRKRLALEKEGVIYTYVNPAKKMHDGRDYGPELDQGDEEILQRFDRYWMIKSAAKKWEKFPELSPKWLIGVSGPPKRRVIIGCVEIDKKAWGESLDEAFDSGFSSLIVPAVFRKGLDCNGVRGLRFDEKSSPKFTQQGHIVVRPV